MRNLTNQATRNALREAAAKVTTGVRQGAETFVEQEVAPLRTRIAELERQVSALQQRLDRLERESRR
ncbi:MAG TPA: hypothetical protein VFI22_02005 [Thermomicrobiales bacterium]|nr:hypothetical protein [Thermomicrobiales bacterium]